MARRLPGLRVGLHLALVEARPVLPAAQLPDLVGADGHFRRDMARAGAAMFFLPRVRAQMRAELRAQFEAFRATGLPLDHVNAHKHFHLHPSIAGEIVALAQEFGVRHVRVPLEPREILARIDPANAASVLVAPFARMLRRRLARAGIATPDQVFGLAWSGAMTTERLRGLLSRLPEGVSEIYVHPATGDGFAGAAPGYAYAAELAALCAPDVRTARAACGAAKGGFADVRRG